MKSNALFDAIYNQTDIVNLDSLINRKLVPFVVEMADKPILVEQINEKTQLEIFVMWVSIIGGIVAFLGAIAAFWQLFKKDREKQEQLNKMTGLVGAIEAQNELIKEGNDNMKNYLIELSKVVSNSSDNSTVSARMVELEEQRLRLLVKPRIWTNGGGYRGDSGKITLDINNRGEICFLDDFNVIDGFKVQLIKWSQPVTIDKNSSIIISGYTKGASPREIKFVLRIYYRDQEDYQYESDIEWNKGVTRLIETRELPKVSNSD